MRNLLKSLLLLAYSVSTLSFVAYIAFAQEKVSLTTPVFQSTGATEFRVWSLTLRRAHPDRPGGVQALFREVSGTGFVSGGRLLECSYEDPDAEIMIVALNKANLTTISLERRLLQRCQMDGKLGAGTVTGTP